MTNLIGLFGDFEAGVVLKDSLSYSVSLGRERTLIIHIGRSEPQSQQENATVDTIWPVCDPPPSHC